MTLRIKFKVLLTTALGAYALCLSGATASEKVATTLPDDIVSHATSLGKKAYTSNRAYTIDESLTTEVGARRVGTPGDAAGIKWAVAKMKALGFDKVWTEKITVPGWHRGDIEAKVIAPYPHRIVAIALGNTNGTGEKGITAPLVHFKTLDDLKNAPMGSLKGKIAFISNQLHASLDGSGYSTVGLQRRLGGKVAAEKGALAIIIRSVGTSHNRIAHTGGQSGDIPAAAISNPDADLLVNIFKRTDKIKFYLKMTSKRVKNVVSANVIGEITGSEEPENYVVMGAHLDSWDRGTGAVDDGMGVGITLAAAQNIIEGGKRPKRSIRVLLFGAEEIGLFGVKQYIEAHKDDIKNHTIGAEWDSGTGKIYALTPGVGPISLNIIRDMAKIMAPYGVALNPENDAKGQSDMRSLGAKGMPAVNFHADETTYFDFHHNDNDVMTSVNKDTMRQAEAIYTIYGWVTANADVDFRK